MSRGGFGPPFFSPFTLHYKLLFIDNGEHGMGLTSQDGAAVWSSEEWIAYFEANAKRLLAIPWDEEVNLSPEERPLIAGSLPSWQLGESSDGARLMASAQKHANSTNDAAFVDVMRMFIKEEQRHGGDLGRFLDLAGVPRKSWDWGDAVFRRVRHLVTHMELSCFVLITVEIHAMLYYASVRRVTTSVALQRICQQILRDEIPHIRFQCERLAILHHGRSRLRRWVALACHRVLFCGVTLAIWIGHRRVLRAGGFSFGRFWRTSWAKMGHAWQMMDPRRYQWANPGLLALGLSRDLR